MAYDKPKVTIDLEEYNDLIKTSTTFTSDEFVVAAKKVVACFLNNSLNIGTTNRYLEIEGIRLIIINPAISMRNSLTWEDILIEKIDKK